MNKAPLRKLFMEKRSSMTVDEYRNANEQILKQVQSLDFRDVEYIHIFLPIIEKKEVDTFPIIVWLKDKHPEIKIIIPKADFTTHELEHFIYNDRMLLEKNKYGILEPTEGEKVNASLPDMVLIPLMTFDMKGYRVGYGKGFYDRFLSQCRNDVQKIGLSFYKPVDAIEDVHESDVRLDCCITPSKIYLFS